VSSDDWNPSRPSFISIIIRNAAISIFWVEKTNPCEAEFSFKKKEKNWATLFRIPSGLLLASRK